MISTNYLIEASLPIEIESICRNPQSPVMGPFTTPQLDLYLPFFAK